jgi:hypothetical protein
MHRCPPKAQTNEEVGGGVKNIDVFGISQYFNIFFQISNLTLISRFPIQFNFQISNLTLISRFPI